MYPWTVAWRINRDSYSPCPVRHMAQKRTCSYTSVCVVA